MSAPVLLQIKQHITPHAPLGTVTSTSPIDIIAIDFLKVERAAGGYNRSRYNRSVHEICAGICY